ncbi:MAG TPA: bifunctional 5,10-methylenetetrahydrofolate dehydrogenase/5,10-methenyltetrahydrofolate cyclohydrolase [Rickettsiales bacterium]|nr:bifunctional 5,10-methylenetetrahydrofolate dehydrogenase/5,10-methenyltetrahydrofolate cyclohydrolase [Rickettsiales bacterium]
MENKIISGTKLSDSLKENIKEKINKISQERNKKPCLAVIIVGNNPASEIYVKNKEKDCLKCDIKSLKFELEEKTTEEELLKLIKKLNNDEEVNGILVQLPLPKHINDKKIMNAILPEKDVDCFNPINIGNIFIGNFDFDNSMLPCTPKGCVKLIKEALGNELSGKKVCIVGRSNIVGKPVAQLLLNENCTVKVVHSKTENLNEETKWADIVIVAIGKPNFLKADMIKDGAIVIDVGINRLENGLCGDADFNNILEKVSYITPVPGGVGPMTRVCLMENVFNAFLKQNNFS